MYQTLALHDDSGHINNRNQIFSVDTIRESRVETIRGHKTSRRTLLVCSLILIATAGLLATWVFVSKPSFYPKINLFSRSIKDKNNFNKKDFSNAHALSSSIIRTRRNIDIYRNATQELVVWKVDFTQNTDSELTIEFVNDPSLFPTNDSRLPTDLVPDNYRVALNIDLEKDSYNGSVKMSLKCINNTKRIIFHGRRLILTRVKIKHEKDIMEYKKITYIKRFDMYVIDFEDPELIKNNTYELQVDYYVTYGKNLAGLYKSNYTTQDKKQRKIVSSHFEPIDARSAFPCFDEPAFKATFDISITHHRNLTALSNMPIKDSVQVDNETMQDNFETTVRMSTYLVAFSVNDFLYKERTTPSGIKVRVYAKEDDYSRIDYPLMAAATIIAFYEEYFQIRYPLPKLDLLAVPEFMAGAMEDWGLVSFRSAYLVYDDQVMTPESLRQVTLVIAHELAHQWFGNLVTMKWWNDIWLNEGFANFVEMIGTNEVNKQFHSLKIQVPTGWQSAISLDSLKNTHAVSPEVKRDSEIDELFDTISYNKGASLLRMVEGFMGDNLIEGVRNYLNEYKYSNAATDDLWKHLSNTSKDHINIKEVMDTWTKQPSFPIITMSRANGSFVIRQEQFLQAKARVDSGGALMNTSFEGDKWIVPFTYVTSENKTMQTVWMKEREMVLNISSDVKWIKANMDSMGFYVVNYDNETWSGLQKQLMEDHEVFSPVNRAGILHDALKLSCELMIEPSIPLDLMRYAKKENSLIPWSMIRSKHECLTLMVNEKELKQKYKRFVWQLQSHLVNKSMLHQNTTRNGTSLTLFERVQRMETFSFGLKNNITRDFKARLEEIFDDMVRYGDRLPGLSPEIRALAITYGHDSFNDAHWDFLWKLYVDSPVDTDRKIIMKAFALYKDKNRVNQMLDKSLDTNTIRVQDTIPFISIIVKISSRKQVWDYVTKNYQKFKDRYSGGYHLGQLLGEIAGGFTKEEELKEVMDFIKEHPIGAPGSRTEKQLLERIQLRIQRFSNATINVRFTHLMVDWLTKDENKFI